jgi:hypothetical protein
MAGFSSRMISHGLPCEKSVWSFRYLEMVRPLFSVFRKTIGSNGGFLLFFRTSSRFIIAPPSPRVILQGGMKRSTQSLRTLKNSYVSSNQVTVDSKLLTFNRRLISLN